MQGDMDIFSGHMPVIENACIPVLPVTQFIALSLYEIYMWA